MVCVWRRVEGCGGGGGGGTFCLVHILNCRTYQVSNLGHINHGVQIIATLNQSQSTLLPCTSVTLTLPNELLLHSSMSSYNSHATYVPDTMVIGPCTSERLCLV